jgi:isopentenyl-diphosphate Delta-isomerase
LGGCAPYTAVRVSISSRKDDHLALCRTDAVGFRDQTTLFECVRFTHNSLPELATRDLVLETMWLGKRLSAPLLIAAMTGGSKDAKQVNLQLAALAEARGYAFGLGSQRAMLKDPRLAETYSVRAVAKTACVLGNIGIVQAREMSAAQVAEVVDAVGADALCLHMNPAMELVQPDGDVDFRGCLAAIERIAKSLPVPVIVKETGSGISLGVGKRLRDVGVLHVDVSGAGGTSWVGVEAKRAEQSGKRAQQALGELFWDWGVPTAASVLQMSTLGFESIVATGGVRNGLEVAKAIALGATLAGIARPVLRALHDGGPDGANAFMSEVETALGTVMLLVGARTLLELRSAERQIVGDLRTYLHP